MKVFVSVVFAVCFSFASEYYAKVEPLNTYNVKAAVSGKVIVSHDNLEGHSVQNKTIIQLDDALNKADLKATQNKLNTLNKMITIEEKNYERLKQISTKSEFEKDTQKLKVLNLLSQKEDLELKITTLKDTINNKHLYEKNAFIYQVSVKEGDFVNPGTLLYIAKDLRKAKLEFFVPIHEAKKLQQKDIYIDNKKTDLKIDTLYKVADEKHISSYKCVIVLPNPKQFSRLVHIKFK